MSGRIMHRFCCIIVCLSAHETFSRVHQFSLAVVRKYSTKQDIIILGRLSHESGNNPGRFQ
uniref:Uncharacterized protein n=1 Tax=Onchocerca volvulus TaxID=6282 RepID=A0A8R1XUP6_ONCVO